MRIFVNRKAVKGPWGGENSFMGALCAWLTTHGHKVTIDPKSTFDFALLNALTLIDMDLVKDLYEKNIPIVHRKTGFNCRGAQELRAITNGIVEGDRRQIQFSPYLRHSIFQSEYSRNVFVEQGFDGPHSIIYNGVDENKFNQFFKSRFLGLRSVSRRNFWNGSGRLKVLTVSWSSDPSKGFSDLEIIDRKIGQLSDVEFSFVGNIPNSLSFDNIKAYPPKNHKDLARAYHENHVLLFLGRHESCSNTITEAINSGMPVIYHPNSANPEMAENYGVPYNDDIEEAVTKVKARYQSIVCKTINNPFRISIAGPKYQEIIEKVYYNQEIE